MPLPQSNTPWPPKGTEPVYQKMVEWAAWYSGDVDRLIDVYGGSTAQGQTPWWRFWCYC